MELLGGEVDFNVVDGFGMILGVELTLVLVNVKGLGGGGKEGRRENLWIQTDLSQ